MHEEPTKNTWLHILNIRNIIEVITVTEVIIGYYEKKFGRNTYINILLTY